MASSSSAETDYDYEDDFPKRVSHRRSKSPVKKLAIDWGARLNDLHLVDKDLHPFAHSKELYRDKCIEVLAKSMYVLGWLREKADDDAWDKVSDSDTSVDYSGELDLGEQSDKEYDSDTSEDSGEEPFEEGDQSEVDVEEAFDNSKEQYEDDWEVMAEKGVFHCRDDVLRCIDHLRNLGSWDQLMENDDYDLNIHHKEMYKTVLFLTFSLDEDNKKAPKEEEKKKED